MSNDRLSMVLCIQFKLWDGGPIQCKGAALNCHYIYQIWLTLGEEYWNCCQWTDPGTKDKGKFSTRARIFPHRHTDRVTTENTISWIQEFFLQPIVKNRSNIGHIWKRNAYNVLLLSMVYILGYFYTHILLIISKLCGWMFICDPRLWVFNPFR